MIFSLQAFLEDYFQKRNLSDVDQYAIKIANVYFQHRTDSGQALLNRLHRIPTAFYRRNTGLERRSVEEHIVASIEANFKRQNVATAEYFTAPELKRERARLQRMPRRSIRDVLTGFQRATEARTIDTIWESRAKGKLRPRAEKIAQAMLTHYVAGVLLKRSGRLFRELASGVGFVDLVIEFGTVAHLIELKIQTRNFSGPAQLETYMRTEGRDSGWLVVFDTRADARKTAIQKSLRTKTGVIYVIVIDVNPTAPSRKK